MLTERKILSPVMILQCVEALGTCTPSHGFELCGQIHRVDRLVRDLSRVLITDFEILVSESSS